MRPSHPREPATPDRGPSVTIIGSGYVGAEVGLRLLDLVVPATRWVTGAMSLLLLLGLTVVIAFWREDDLLEAGVLFALLMGLAALLTGVLREVWLHPSVWTVVTAIPPVGFALLFRTVVGGIAASAVIWVLRLARPAAGARSA